MKQVFYIIIIVFFVLSSQSISAQSDEYDDYTDDSEQPTAAFGHWDLGLNFGLYWPSKFHAGFYDGSSQNVNNINYVLNNQYWHDEIKNALNAADDFYLRELPTNMRYTVAFQIGMYFRKTFDNYTGFSLQFDYSKLTASDFFTLEVDPQPSIGKEPDIRIYPIWGIEDRINIDLLFSKYFKTNSKMIVPFFEGGLNINSSLVKEHKIQIENLTYSLVNVYLNGGYIPGSGQNTYKVQQGGIGWGVSAAAGVKLVFNESVSIDPGFRVYYQKVKLEGYEQFKPSFALFIRLSLSDFFAGGEDNYTNEEY